MARNRRLRFPLRIAPLALAAAFGAAWAQPGAPGTPAAPTGPGAPPAPVVTPTPGVRIAPSETPPPADAPPRSISPRPGTPIAKGKVSRLLPNADGEVDGLMLSDGTQVRFPPHMTQELASTVKPGSPVSVEGYREAGGAVRARVITEESTGRSVVERDPAPAPVSPSPPPTEVGPLSAEGRIRQLMRDPAGDVNGVVLEDGSVVRFAPSVRRQFPGVLQPGNAISAAGHGTQSRFGTALDATTLNKADGNPQPPADQGRKGGPATPGSTR